jgi:integrase
LFKQPKTPKKLIPIIRDDDTKKVIGTCRGKTFIQLRDEAIIRLYYNTGARLSEAGNLALDHQQHRKHQHEIDPPTRRAGRQATVR